MDHGEKLQKNIVLLKNIHETQCNKVIIISPIRFISIDTARDDAQLYTRNFVKILVEAPKNITRIYKNIKSQKIDDFY